jgi:hypothetical protein
MNDITVEEVFQAVAEKLRTNSKLIDVEGNKQEG